MAQFTITWGFADSGLMTFSDRIQAMDVQHAMSVLVATLHDKGYDTPVQFRSVRVEPSN